MHARVAHQAFERVFADVAIAAVQLQRLVADVEARIGRIVLGVGGIGAAIALACVEQSAGQGYHLGRRDVQGGHVG